MPKFIPSEVSEQIVKILKDKNGNDVEIETKDFSTYTSIKFLGIHTLRIKCGRKNFVYLKNSYEHIWDSDKSIKVERLKSEELWSRVSFDTQEELERLFPLFLKLYEEAFSLLNVEIFSCCSRFVQCSDNKACIQPDKRLSFGCQYGKSLTSGKILYGKNRNVI